MATGTDTNLTDDQQHDDDQHQHQDRDRAAGRDGGGGGRGRDDDRGDAESLRAELERARKALQEANRKAAADRRRLDEIEEDRRRKEQEQLPEVERIRADKAAADKRAEEADRRAEKAERDRLDLLTDHEVERAARAGGQFVEPAAAPRLVDRSRIDYDAETGKFTGVKEALERVLKDYPNLAARGRTSGGGSPAGMDFKAPARPAPDQGSGQARDQKPSVRDFFLQTGNYQPL